MGGVAVPTYHSVDLWVVCLLYFWLDVLTCHIVATEEKKTGEETLWLLLLLLSSLRACLHHYSTEGENKLAIVFIIITN